MRRGACEGTPAGEGAEPDAPTWTVQPTALMAMTSVRDALPVWSHQAWRPTSRTILPGVPPAATAVSAAIASSRG